MPGVKNTTKPQSRYAKAANSKNEKAIDAAISGEGSFGRVEKSLGNRQFHVRFHNGKEPIQLLAVPRGVFSAGGKARVIISVGDIVLLDGLQDMKKDLIVEITGRLEKKQAQQLFKSGRIHKTIYSTDEEVADDLFDYQEKPEDEEVDVDAI